MDPDEALCATGSRAGGLTGDEAAERSARDGRNEIVERHEPFVARLLRHWWGPMPWMIEAALGLSLATRHWADAAIIGALPVNAMDQGAPAAATAHQ